MTMLRLFTDHPRSVGESYGRHALVAARFGAAMIAGGLACCVHAALPALFARTGSSTVRRLHREIAARARVAEQAGVHPDQFWAYEI